MGGKNPTIVTENADLDRAAAGIARSAYGMGGQKCSALSRLYVHEKVADTLLEKVEKEIDKIRIGDPTERATGLGPVVNKRAHESYARYVADLKSRGAKIRRGGKQPRKARSRAATTSSRCSRRRTSPIRSGSTRCSCRS